MFLRQEPSAIPARQVHIFGTFSFPVRAFHPPRKAPPFLSVDHRRRDSVRLNQPANSSGRNGFPIRSLIRPLNRSELFRNGRVY